MPRKTSARSTRAVRSRSASAKAKGFLSQVKWGESYTSLFLGAVVVVVVFVLAFSFIKSRSNMKGQTQSTSTVSQEETAQGAMPKMYTVKKGDYLWSIAEKIYGSGYNWVDLANSNKLQNPNILYVGTKLVVPDVKSKELTVQNDTVQQSNLITVSSYTVIKGDFLWGIAVRAYGDGYKWVEIAKANNLVNPSLIHPGNVLKLPR
jgi:nucleoid-associated protein YgaU